MLKTFSREVVGGGAGGARAPPIIWDFAPIQYLLNRKIPIYCVPLQYQFSDYLPGHTIRGTEWAKWVAPNIVITNMLQWKYQLGQVVVILLGSLSS